jgi:hypothetical protein
MYISVGSFTFSLCLIGLITWLLLKLCEKQVNNFNLFKTVNIHLDMVCSFIRIFDSRYNGLFMFMISNYLTFFINLILKDTHSYSEVSAVFIISFYSFLVTFFGFLFYKYLNKSKFK